VYRCQIDGKEAYSYCIVEHQRTPDPLLPFRILQYKVALMEQHLAQGNKKLPSIMNLCLYAGKESPYPYSTDIYDCFEEPALARREIFKALQLIDLTVRSEAELMHHGEADLVEILLKQAVVCDFLAWLSSNKALIVSLLNRFYAESGIVYMLEVDEKNDPDKLIEAILAAVPDKKDRIMTAAQKLKARSLQQGL